MEIRKGILLFVLPSLAVAVVISILISRLYKWFSSPLCKIPGPPGYPIVGNLFDLKGDIDILEVFTKWEEKFGGVFKYCLPTIGYTVYIADRNMIKQVAITEASSFQRFGAFASTDTPTVFDANRAENVRQRKIVQPKLAYFAIKTYFPLFNTTTLKLVKIWKELIDQSGGDTIRDWIGPRLQRLTMDVMCQSAFNYNANCLEYKDGGEFRMIEVLLSGVGISQRELLDKAIPILRLLPSEERKNFHAAQKNLHNRIMERVDHRRQENKKSGGQKPNDLFQIIIDMYDHESEPKRSVALCKQVTMFMGAGYDTTSNALTWTLYLLAKHPDKQQKARQEVQDVIKGQGSLTWESLGDLEYADCCIKEALRLHGPAIRFGRSPEKDVKIGQYDIPKGTQLMCSVFRMHCNESFWENPKEYKPERFANLTDKDEMFLFSFLPFSRGPRSCIGRKFAEVEMKVVVSHILNHFELSLPEGHHKMKGMLRGVVYTYEKSPELVIRALKSNKA